MGKRLLLVALASLMFTSSAFAWGEESTGIKAVWLGDAMLRGTYVSNADGSKNAKEKFFLESDFNFGVALTLTEGLKITVRGAIFDTDMGRSNERWDRTYATVSGADGKGRVLEVDDNFRIERAFINYDFGFGDKKKFHITAGRLFSAPFGHNYGKEFGRRDGIILGYDISKSFSFRGFYYARKESSGRDVYAIGKNSMDQHTFGGILSYFNRSKDGRMDLFSAAIDINSNPACDSVWTNEPCMSYGYPTPTEVGNKRNTRYFASLYGSQRKAKGFSWIAEVMTDTRDVNGATSAAGVGSYTTWGAIVEPYYNWEKLQIGARLTYASWDNDHNTGFDWGGEYVTTGANIQDTMDIIHDWLFDYRLKGVNMVQLNGKYRLNPKWEVKAFVSYFFSSMTDDDDYATANNVTSFSGRDATAFGKDTTAIEIDLNLRYNIMPRTYIDLGLAHFQMNDRVQPQVMYYPATGRPVELKPYQKGLSSDPIEMVYLRMMIQY